MKTTLVISDPVLARLREEATRTRRTLSEIVESALRRYFEDAAETRELEPLPTFDGGGARVDVANREALYRLMEEG